MSFISHPSRNKAPFQNIQTPHPPRHSITYSKIPNKLINGKIKVLKNQSKPKTKPKPQTPLKTSRNIPSNFSSNSFYTPHNKEKPNHFNITYSDNLFKYPYQSTEPESTDSFFNEIDKFKIQSQKNKEKICVFIKLIYKYTTKMTSLTQMLSPNLLIENDIVLDLSNTITKFSEMISNSKLNDIFFDNNNISHRPRSCYPSFVEVNNDNKQVIAFKNEDNNFQTEINKLKEELNDIKKKYQLAIEKNELFVQINKELENKVLKLENKNENNYEIIKELNEKILNYDLLQKNNEILENELNYKNNVIKYLENKMKASGMQVSYTEDDDSIMKLSIDMDEQVLLYKEQQINDLDQEILSLKGKLKQVLNKK